MKAEDITPELLAKGYDFKRKNAGIMKKISMLGIMQGEDAPSPGVLAYMAGALAGIGENDPNDLIEDVMLGWVTSRAALMQIQMETGKSLRELTEESLGKLIKRLSEEDAPREMKC